MKNTKVAVTKRGPEPRAVPVTLRAIIQRINRKLADKGEVLRATRGNRWRGDMGDYYAIDIQRNCVVAQHVDPAQWAREIGVLKPYEKIQ